MSCRISFRPLKAWPSLSPQHRKTFHSITIKHFKLSCNSSNHKNSSTIRCSGHEAETSSDLNRTSLPIQIAALLSTAADPALAVTGMNNEQDLTLALIKIGIVAFWYFFMMPPIIMNWMRIRWYRRGLLKMYLQVMFVFMFFPGTSRVLLWAPFLNFRKFPRDPSMKYPWSKPEDPSRVRGGYHKYPWATLKDYE